ncbi:hypothetical protein Rs2_28954 [Raphanus sativus]|uniref:Uncharacterized protein LOC108812629 n=1 Tax=Raphanus sativus TaxID=3726 RepID=A0A6J0K0F4_RAPSA|nr:uncharacterized protein LOC108812629 [Raphanus sativus]KAJ4889206.1 hypothetical protein Rs2_28954 [Raphanus sativus]
MASPPIPNRPNPKPRNSEAGDPLRRSFGGNPFPVNSKVNVPSDVSRRNSFGGRENSRLDFSDKENETKAFPPTTPKGSKNFMSPTISAVSKINPSPRKRVILSDKNQVSRSLSDVKGLTFEEDTKSHQSCVSFSDDEKKKRFERPHDMTVTDFDESEVLDDKGIVYSDPRFRISPRPCLPYTSPEFPAAPSLLPPYDPKKNYLSPRPQFLHYRPNPRVEKHFDECKQLEELFISESSSSDTELSAEEQEKDVSHEGGDEAVAGEKTEDVEQVESESDEEMVCESIEVTSQVPKQSGSRPFRFIGWFLALSLGYLLVSASFSGPTGLSILMESPLHEFHLPNGIKEFAEGNKLEELSERLWTLTEASLVYVSKMMSRLGGVTEEYAPLQFHNLTYSLEESTVFQPTRVEINGEPLHEKVRGEDSLEDDYEHEFEEESGEEENSEIEDGKVDEETEMPPGTDIELKEGEKKLEAIVIEEPEVILAEVNNDAEGLESQENLETGSIKKDQVEIEADTEAIYIDQHDVETAAIKAHQQIDSVLADAESGAEEGFRDITAETSDDLHPEVAGAESEPEETVREIAAETSEDVHPEARSFNKAMIVLSSTVMVLLAAVAFLFTKKAKHVTVSASEPAPEPVENLVKEKLSSLNIQAEVEEEVDDRISNSVHKKSSSLSNNKGPKEQESLGGNNSKLRRESMASSASEYSVGSFSYGSFTTYEKIPIKSGDGEEEMITPVRRSSRIRKHLQPSSML